MDATTRPTINFMESGKKFYNLIMFMMHTITIPVPPPNRILVTRFQDVELNSFLISMYYITRLTNILATVFTFSHESYKFLI